jgi:hypothetical protein
MIYLSGYGSALLGYHHDTWTLISFAVAIVLLAAILLFDRQFQGDGAVSPISTGAFAYAAVWLVVGLTAPNVASTLLECSLGACADNLMVYGLLRRARQASALKLPTSQTMVFAMTANAKALHQNEIAHRPSNCLDGPLLHDTIAVKQGHMRRKTRSHSAKSNAFHRFAKQPIEAHERSIVARAQHEWQALSIATKTHCTIEHDVERPHRNPRCSLLGRRHLGSGRAVIQPDAMQRYMEQLCRDRPPLQSVFMTQALTKLHNRRSIDATKEECEKQAI